MVVAHEYGVVVVRINPFCDGCIRLGLLHKLQIERQPLGRFDQTLSMQTVPKLIKVNWFNGDDSIILAIEFSLLAWNVLWGIFVTIGFEGIGNATEVLKLCRPAFVIVGSVDEK
ncbi:MAG: hypothetical protein DCC65_10735 [Planctomycetota bacterium]|nr:MAG: hypothetical protein DCC65_10735 [Planctomycetota bacterium]